MSEEKIVNEKKVRYLPFMFCGKCGKKIMLETTTTCKPIYKMYECIFCGAFNLPMEE